MQSCPQQSREQRSKRRMTNDVSAAASALSQMVKKLYIVARSKRAAHSTTTRKATRLDLHLTGHVGVEDFSALWLVRMS